MTTNLRPAVRSFAEAMEQKLRENDHKGGWTDLSIYWLIQRIGDEHRELIDAVLFNTNNPQAIINECADVANFAMMVADIVQQHSVQNGLQTPSAPDTWRSFLLSTSAPPPTQNGGQKTEAKLDASSTG